MANSNENSLNAHLHNPDFNPTYIYRYFKVNRFIEIIYVVNYVICATAI